MLDVILMSIEEKCKLNLNIYFIYVNFYMWSLFREYLFVFFSFIKKVDGKFYIFEVIVVYVC